MNTHVIQMLGIRTYCKLLWSVMVDFGKMCHVSRLVFPREAIKTYSLAIQEHMLAYFFHELALSLV